MLQFNCVHCGEGRFSLNAESIENGDVPVASFVCPQCHGYTAVQKRDGGGITIAPDAHAMKGKSG